EVQYFDMYSIPVLQSDSFFSTVITFKDTTIKTQKEIMLHHLAFHDSLTNVHNRAYFIKYSEKILQVAKENKMRVGIIFSDLDKLKQVNDNCGHKYGDLALQRVSKILQIILKDKEGLFRMGGDEFVAIITDENIISSLDKICLKIEKEICKQYIVDNKDISVGITSGYSIFPEETDNFENLLNIADRRMYARKRAKNLKRYE
ncbi:MAG: GGDEF domain-containing protein, partial [Spirochaetaceae bacterium]|nr:GGDEF domain-containing protein [Spirochaetaceae bacterium]